MQLFAVFAFLFSVCRSPFCCPVHEGVSGLFFFLKGIEGKEEQRDFLVKTLQPFPKLKFEE